MTDKLKSAIITIAGYMGTKVIKTNERGELGYWKSYDVIQVFETVKFHTSADALLEVWRKVRKEMQMWRISHVRASIIIVDYILDGNYPTACIELAEIIQTLKQKP